MQPFADVIALKAGIQNLVDAPAPDAELVSPAPAHRSGPRQRLRHQIEY